MVSSLTSAHLDTPFLFAMFSATGVLAGLYKLISRRVRWIAGVYALLGPGLWAVSYTHLDVYKRQTLRPRIPWTGFTPALKHHGPVSKRLISALSTGGFSVAQANPHGGENPQRENEKELYRIERCLLYTSRCV